MVDRQAEDALFEEAAYSPVNSREERVRSNVVGDPFILNKENYFAQINEFQRQNPEVSREDLYQGLYGEKYVEIYEETA